MKTSTLFTAFAAAQTRTTSPAALLEPSAELPSAQPRSPAHESLLVNALRNSATACDQIMQRRIGLLCEPDKIA